MRLNRSIMAVIGGMSVIAGASPAFAGHCGVGIAPQLCGTSVVVNQGAAPRFDPMTVNITQPMGHLRSVKFNRAPNVSIMRVHGMGPTAGLQDAPSGFTNGCHPTSTQYCRQSVGRPVSVTFNQPQPAPFIATPAPAPVISNAVPRQYGDNTLTPGIAHIPTSIVDRSSANAQAVLNSGRTVRQSTQLGGIAPQQRMVTSSASSRINGPVASDGSYWEQVSGPTMFGNTLATKVVCKRQAPRPVLNAVRVVRPIVGVRYPVPVPVPVQAGCVQAPFGQAPSFPRFGGTFAGPQLAGGLHGGQAGRWIR